VTPIAFTLSESDVLAGNRLAMRRSVRKGLPRFALILIMIALGITLFAYAMNSQPLPIVAILFAKVFAIYSAVGGVIMLILLFVMPKQRAKKNMAQMPALGREQMVAWDNTTIAFTSHYGNVQVPFADLHQWAADDGIVIIYPADHLFHMIPERLFNAPSDRDGLIAALEASGVKRI